MTQSKGLRTPTPKMPSSGKKNQYDGMKEGERAGPHGTIIRDSTGAKEMDSGQILEGSEFERIAELVGGGKVDSSMIKELDSKPALPKLNQIAQLILEVDSRAVASDDSKEQEIKNHNRGLLAAQLGCRPEDLQEIVDSYGDQWHEYVLEERIRHNMHSTHMRDVTWDRLEAVTLGKLNLLIEQFGHRLTVAELLAVAKTANQANRGNREKPQGIPGGGGPAVIGQQNIFMPGAPQDGILPAGNLGTISLNLSDRVLKQLNRPKVIEGESERVIDSMEMMGIKDVQEIGERMDKEEKDK